MHNATHKDSNVERFCTEAIAARMELQSMSHALNSIHCKLPRNHHYISVINRITLMIPYMGGKNSLYPGKEDIINESIRWLATFSRWQTTLWCSSKCTANQPHQILAFLWMTDRRKPLEVQRLHIWGLKTPPMICHKTVFFTGASVCRTSGAPVYGVSVRRLRYGFTPLGRARSPPLTAGFIWCGRPV